MRAFWGWLSAPRISAADILLYSALVIAADALKLSSHLPWPAVLAVVWGSLALFAVGAGFVKGFGRSALRDMRRLLHRRES